MSTNDYVHTSDTAIAPMMPHTNHRHCMRMVVTLWWIQMILLTIGLHKRMWWINHLYGYYICDIDSLVHRHTTETDMYMVLTKIGLRFSKELCSQWQILISFVIMLKSYMTILTNISTPFLTRSDKLMDFRPIDFNWLHTNNYYPNRCLLLDCVILAHLKSSMQMQ